MAGFEKTNPAFRRKVATDPLVGRGGVAHPCRPDRNGGIQDTAESACEIHVKSTRRRPGARSASVLSAAAILLGIDQLPGGCAMGRQFQA